MSPESHSQIASFIWSICNLLRGPYRWNEYRKVIFPLTVLRRFDCILAPTREAVLKEHALIKTKGENIIRHRLSQITGVPVFNFSKFTMATHQPVQRERVVSKIFDNEDFGYYKITVERPLRLNFQATAERIARIEDESGFKNLAVSRKKAGTTGYEEKVAAGKAGQDEIRTFLHTLGDQHWKDREAFVNHLRQSAKSANVRPSASELKAELAALGEPDETAEICRDAKGNPEPDPELRDTRTVPLKEVTA
jgi:hypothetical protein